MPYELTKLQPLLIFVFGVIKPKNLLVLVRSHTFDVLDLAIDVELRGQKSEILRKVQQLQ